MNASSSKTKISNHMHTSTHKKDVINTLQFIARQYSCLTDIVDQLNYCYSFQVRWSVFVFSFFNLLLAISLSHQNIILLYTTLGDDNHWNYVYVFCFYCLFIPSTCNRRYSPLSIWTLASHDVANLFSKHYIDDNLCCSQSYQRSLYICLKDLDNKTNWYYITFSFTFDREEPHHGSYTM